MAASGFKKGWNLIPLGKKKEITEKILAILNVTTRSSLSNYRSGKLDVTVGEAEQIEQMFNSYGIYEIWGQN